VVNDSLGGLLIGLVLQNGWIGGGGGSFAGGWQVILTITVRCVSRKGAGVRVARDIFGWLTLNNYTITSCRPRAKNAKPKLHIS